MKGKAKLVRESDGKYHVYAKNYFWQRWKPLYYNDYEKKQIVFSDFNEFGKVTQIECFDTIIIKYDKFSGYREN